MIKGHSDRKFIEKYNNIVPRVCSTCGTWNLPKYERCGNCKGVLLEKNEVAQVTFCDIKCARGDWWAEPIQIGLIQYDLQLRKIVAELCINVKVDSNIYRMSALHSHKLKYSRDKSFLVTKKGEQLPIVYTEEATRML